MKLSIIRRKKNKEKTNDKRKRALPVGKPRLKLHVSAPGRFKLKVEEPHPKYLMDEEELERKAETKAKRKSRKSRKRDEVSGLPKKSGRRWR